MHTSTLLHILHAYVRVFPFFRPHRSRAREANTSTGQYFPLAAMDALDTTHQKSTRIRAPCTRRYTCSKTCIRARAHAHTHAHVHTHIHKHTHKCTRTHTHAHAHTHTHITPPHAPPAHLHTHIQKHIRTAAQQAMRRAIELYSATTRFALACNNSSEIIEPIQSRCAILRFTKLSDKVCYNCTHAHTHAHTHTRAHVHTHAQNHMLYIYGYTWYKFVHTHVCVHIHLNTIHVIAYICQYHAA